MEAVRTCVGCKKFGTRNSLVRIVAVENTLTLDLEKKLSGRGAWLHVGRECLKLAVDRKAFGRALKGQFEIDLEGLTQSIEQAEKMLASNE